MPDAGSSSNWYQDMNVLEATVRSSFGHRHSAPLIDGYTDVKELSRGGQGVVYLATQQSTKRTVAIKVLLDGMYASTSRRVRFEREIGLAANLHHANIVRVYDSGVTDDGRLFLVMEYIEGTPLDVFAGSSHRGDTGPTERQGQTKDPGSADPTLIPGEGGQSGGSVASGQSFDESTRGNLLDIRAGIKLFAKVCDAVSHAHQHGVIHRDLKPSNIHVDARGEPHILDFGLAKSAPGSPFDPTESPVVSMTGNFMGSAPWASPEQAAGDTNSTDTRTDVYALGVILYQMLTGRFPYRVAGNLRDVLNNIITTMPARPSLIRRRIDDELDTIVLKCLEKEPERRYQTASELAMDVHRYLAGEPIEAKRASAWYAVRRTLRRYQFAAAALGVILLISVAFAITSLVLYSQANVAKAAEQEARQAAQAQATTANRIREFLETMLTSIDPANAKGRDITLLVDVLNQAADRIETELAGQPEIAASLNLTIGQTFQHLSRLEDADRHIFRSYETFLKEFGPNDTRTIAAQNDLGVLRSAQGRFEECEEILRDALRRSRDVRGKTDTQTIEVASNLGVALRRLNKADEAESILREAINALTDTGAPADRRLLLLINNLGSALQQQGELEEALANYRKALEGFTELYGEKNPDTLISLANVAHLLGELNRLDEAEGMLRENLERSREIFGDEHIDTLTAMNNLGHLLSQQKRYTKAEKIFREALAGRRKLLGDEHEHTLLTMSNLSVCLQSQNMLDEAEALQQQSVAVLRRKHGDTHLSTMIGMNNLASLLHMRDKDEEAEAMLRIACGNAAKTLGEDHWITAAFQSNLGNTFVSMKRYDEAEPILLNCLNVIVNALGSDHPQAAGVREKLVRLYDEWGKPDIANTYREAAVVENSGS